ncbi:MAG: 30S ribosomal protein S6 [Clostridia bacterium]|nr:30S ribosomal protein S6 [Clostridia bacterium]
MAKYEMLVLLNNESEDETKEAIIAKLEGVVTKLGGTVVSTDKWGAKKLAYPINFKKEAYYVLLTFEGEGNICAELVRVSGIDSEIYRQTIVKIA